MSGARAGRSGDNERSSSAAPLIKKIRRIAKVPILLGFGISNSDQVRAALTAGADGAISGNAVVNIIPQHAAKGNLRGRRRSILAEEIREFIADMGKVTVL
ncbi:MAG: hypothetical protein GY835_26195 [bacterium]|nr:hypothetical protein [bacterium]